MIRVRHSVSASVGIIPLAKTLSYDFSDNNYTHDELLGLFDEWHTIPDYYKIMVSVNPNGIKL